MFHGRRWVVGVSRDGLADNKRWGQVLALVLDPLFPGIWGNPELLRFVLPFEVAQILVAPLGPMWLSQGKRSLSCYSSSL